MPRDLRDLVGYERPPDPDAAWLQRELDEAHKTVRALLRQLDKAQARYDELARAYKKTVANLMRVTAECTMLERERDGWRYRAECAEREQAAAVMLGDGRLRLTAEEVGAIRKAMARLHHPDLGGDPERMKLWNAALDPLEHGAP